MSVETKFSKRENLKVYLTIGDTSILYSNVYCGPSQGGSSALVLC